MADHRHGMRALSLVFSGEEAAAEHGGNADGVEVVGGDDAAGGALGAIAHAERGAGDFADEERLAEGATSLEVLEIGPREEGAPGFVARGAADGDEALLMRDGGIGAEEDAFDPTEDSGVGPDAEGKGQNPQQRKSRAAGQQPECK